VVTVALCRVPKVPEEYFGCWWIELLLTAIVIDAVERCGQIGDYGQTVASRHVQNELRKLCLPFHTHHRHYHHHHHHFLLAPLWVGSATRSKQPPEWAILSHIDSFSVSMRLWDSRSLRTVLFIHVIRGRPGGLFPSSGGNAVNLPFGVKRIC